MDSDKSRITGVESFCRIAYMINTVFKHSG